MKKLLVMICVILLMTGMAGCGDGDSGNSGSPDGQQSSGTDGNQGQSSEAAGGQSQGDEDRETGTVANGYDYANGWTEEMSAIRTAVTDALGEDYWPNMQLTPDLLEMTFGLTEDMYEDYLAESPMISVNVDTMVVVKPKAGREAAVEEKLGAYRDMLVSDSMQYPMNLGKVQASRVDRIGNYICFVQLGADTQEALEDSEEAVIVQCQAANERALEAIRAYLGQ